MGGGLRHIPEMAFLVEISDSGRSVPSIRFKLNMRAKCIGGVVTGASGQCCNKGGVESKMIEGQLGDS